jgi:hypothetical protein
MNNLAYSCSFTHESKLYVGIYSNLNWGGGYYKFGYTERSRHRNALISPYFIRNPTIFNSKLGKNITYDCKKQSLVIHSTPVIYIYVDKSKVLDWSEEAVLYIMDRQLVVTNIYGETKTLLQLKALISVYAEFRGSDIIYVYNYYGQGNVRRFDALLQYGVSFSYDLPDNGLARLINEYVAVDYGIFTSHVYDPVGKRIDMVEPNIRFYDDFIITSSKYNDNSFTMFGMYNPQWVTYHRILQVGYLTKPAKTDRALLDN